MTPEFCQCPRCPWCAETPTTYMAWFWSGRSWLARLFAAKNKVWVCSGCTAHVIEVMTEAAKRREATS